MTSPYHLAQWALWAVLGCLCLCAGSHGLVQHESSQLGPLGSGARGRRLQFDSRELEEMETLRATEDHQLAVLDGTSKPLFSNRYMFSPEPVLKWFGDDSSGSILEPARQQAEAGTVLLHEGSDMRGGVGADAVAAAQAKQQQRQQQLGRRGGGRGQGDRQQQDTGGSGGWVPVQMVPEDETEAPGKGSAPGSGNSSGKQAPDSRQQAPGSRQQAPGGQKQAPGSRQQAPGGKKQASGSQQQRRQQRPRSPPSPDPAVLSLLLDSAPGEESENIPEPELQFKEEGGTRVLIWQPADTLPRDLLLQRRPKVWLYSLLMADYGAASMVPHFLDHYLKLGVSPERMLLMVHTNPSLPTTPGGAVSEVTSLLSAYGLDYRVWRGQYTQEAHLKRMLQVLARVPIQDWVLVAEGDELLDFGGLSAPQFLTKRDREGTNWVRGIVVDRVSATGALPSVEPAPSIFSQFPLQCDVSRKVALAEGSKVAAFKAYLRPKSSLETVLGAAAARPYFGPGPQGESNPRGAPCGTEDLLPLTPYLRYRNFYRCPEVAGNSYLWDQRESEAQVKIHSFKWRGGLERSVGDKLAYFKVEAEGCSSPDAPKSAPWEEVQRISDTVVAKGALDVGNAYLKCRLAEEVQLPGSRGGTAPGGQAPGGNQGGQRH